MTMMAVMLLSWFQCDLCGRTFSHRSWLRRHKEGVHKLARYKCNYCDRIFSRVSSVFRHHRSQHSDLITNWLVLSTSDDIEFTSPASLAFVSVEFTCVSAYNSIKAVIAGWNVVFHTVEPLPVPSFSLPRSWVNRGIHIQTRFDWYKQTRRF